MKSAEKQIGKRCLALVIVSIFMMGFIGVLRVPDPPDFHLGFFSYWDTTNPGESNSSQIKLPLEESGTYDFTVNWGDGTREPITSWNQSETTHTYEWEGKHQIHIYGIIVGWCFNNGGDRLKLLEIWDWGDLRLGNSGGYFAGCSNLDIWAWDELNLTGTTNLRDAFRDCRNVEEINGIEYWNVSSVTNMSSMFNGVNLSTANYDKLLKGWGNLPTLQVGVPFDAGYSTYNHTDSEVMAARNRLVNDFNWSMYDGGPA